MPELPEVETVRRAMEAHLVGRTVRRAWSSGLPLREPLSRSRVRSLAGDTFTSASRRAKYLLLGLASQRTLLVHLGMTGNLLFRAGPAGARRRHEPHDHVALDLDAGPPLVFSDPRRFGLFRVLTAAELARSPHLRDLGVEPLSAAFDADYLERACRGRRRPIKSLLLDGRVIAGLGNIYAAEALFEAGIRPHTPAQRLGRERLHRLVGCVQTVLRRAIRRGGTTISDYLGSGSGGRFQLELSVYGRLGQDCLVCDRPLRGLVLAGRSTVYCPRCQR